MSTGSELRNIEVDAASDAGIIRSLQGIGGAPKQPITAPSSEAGFFGIWAPFLRYTGVDVSEGYRMAAIDIIRTHDMPGAGDLDSRYSGEMALADGTTLDLATLNDKVMFPNLDADPEDPASYNFGPTDELVQSIVDVGAEVIFRIGRTILADTTPPDPDKYATIVKHVVMHYNHGWNNGFRHGIRYWELWNEPDYNFPIGFWSGSPEQFYELYAKVAAAIKALDPALLVGGPAISVSNDVQPFREGFIDYAQANRVPLDFFSWHWYAIGTNDPMDFTVIGNNIRKILDDRGFHRTQIINDEWNCDIMSDAAPLSPAGRAAFMTSAVLYMHDSPVDKALYYNGYTPFGSDGASPNEVGHALIMLGKLKRTPVRLNLKGADQNGFAAIAGKSSDGKEVQILLSNYEIPPAYLEERPDGDLLMVSDGVAGGKVTRPPLRKIKYEANEGYRLAVRNLSGSASHTIERYRVCDQSTFSLVDRQVLRGTEINLNAGLPPPGIELVVIRSE